MHLENVSSKHPTANPKRFHRQRDILFGAVVFILAFGFYFVMQLQPTFAVFGVYSPLVERRLASLKLRYILAALFLILAAGWAVTLARAIAQNSGN